MTDFSSGEGVGLEISGGDYLGVLFVDQGNTDKKVEEIRFGDDGKKKEWRPGLLPRPALVEGKRRRKGILYQQK